jgi:hypothetical protein
MRELYRILHIQEQALVIIVTLILHNLFYIRIS